MKVAFDVDVLYHLVKSVRILCERAIELETKLADAEAKIARLEAEPSVIAKQDMLAQIVLLQKHRDRRKAQT